MRDFILIGFFFFLIIPPVLIIKYGGDKVEEVEEVSTSKFSNDSKNEVEETFGPWKVKELEEDGWTKTLTRVAPAKGLSRAWVIGQFRTAEFSTNPPDQDVFFENGGVKHPLDAEVKVKANSNLYFGSRTGKRVIVYIKEGPIKN